MKEFKYDVAISFAGEQREYAKELANKMTNCGLNVFYDRWNPVAAWGRDLKEYLSEVYVNDAQYIIVLFSKEYVEKDWPKYELRLVQKEKDNNILPISVDGSIPAEWNIDRAYINADDYSVDQIAVMVRDRVFNLYSDIDNSDDYDAGRYAPPETIVIESEDGVKEECEIILAFELTDVDREYVVYTKNEIDDHGDVTIYVSNVVKEDGEPLLQEVIDEDWPRIKEFLREIATDDEYDDVPALHGVFKNKDGDEFLAI